MRPLIQRAGARRGWTYIGSGALGAVLIAGAAAWACTPISGTGTNVNPNNTTASGSVGVNVNTYTTNSGTGLPTVDNNNVTIDYYFRFRPASETGSCEHQAALGAAANAVNGKIATSGSPLTRTVVWDTLYDHENAMGGPYGEVCWAAGGQHQNDHASNGVDFALL